MLAPSFTVTDDKVATLWLGRWCAGCAWGGRGNKWFLRVLPTSCGRGRMLVLQTPRIALGVGRYGVKR